MQQVLRCRPPGRRRAHAVSAWGRAYVKGAGVEGDLVCGVFPSEHLETPYWAITPE